MDDGYQIIYRWKDGKLRPMRFKIASTNEFMNNLIKNKGEIKTNTNTSYDDTNFEYLPEDEDQAYDKYVEMSDESHNKLNRDDEYLINNFYIKHETSYDINKALRDGNENAVNKDVLNSLDKACLTYTAEKNMASTRYVNFDYLRNAYGLEIQQYGDFDRSVVADQMKEFIGSEISSKAYTSVSLNESGNGMFNNLAVKMKVNIPKGTKMFVADNVEEYEAILGRNTKMVLKDVKFQDSKIQGFEKEYGKVLLTYEVEK